MTDGFLAGGGELGELTRALDWGETPVGPPSAWPQSLRTAVSIVLASKFGMMIAWGPELTQFYNDAFRPILGASKHPALGKSTRDTFAEAWHIVGPLFEQVFAGSSVGFEDMLVPLDRYGYLEECYFHYNYTPIRDESGGVGGLLVTVVETTDRVLAERRLRTLRDLAAQAGQAQDEADAWSRAGAALAKNPADLPFALLYAIDGDRATLASPPPSPLAPPGIDLGDHDARWPLARALGGEAILVDDPEKALLLPITRPGLARPYGVVVAGLSARRALDDRYRDFLSLVADQLATTIAGARALAEERRRAAALVDLDRQKTQFFSNVSHELRTPLALMLGPTEDALASPRRALEGEALETVYRNALRLLKLVNTLLDFARVEAGRMAASPEPTDLATLTRDLASAFDSVALRSGLTMHVDCPPLDAPVWVDREMWEKVVLNLLSNAFKFTFEGHIAVTLRAAGERVELIVADTGVGIAPHELPRIFERFHRIEGMRARTHEGSGIGLALVRELVKLHGGDVHVRSELGRGTTFTVAVPRAAAGLAAAAAGRQLTARPSAMPAVLEEIASWQGAQPEPAPAPPDAAAHILVVDDNADMRAYLTRILRARWRVTAVGDGRAALEQLAREPVDLVLTDVMMPVLDGFGLLRALRAAPATEALPVIMVSARAGDEARIEGLEAGADDYLVKPFSAKEVAARVATQLQVARLRRQAELERERLRAQLMQAPVPMCVVVGPELRFELANPRFVAMFGGRPLDGKTLREALPAVAADAPIVDAMRRVYATGQPVTADALPVRVDRDGATDERFVALTAQPYRDPAGAVLGVMTAAIDVTPQVKASRELQRLADSERRARGEAEAANRAKDAFLAMLGHELRNPLAPIVTSLQLMRMRGHDSREHQVIERQVGHLMRLVDDLLDISRITRGKVELRREPVELGRVVLRGVEMAGPLLEQRGQRLDLHVPPLGLVVHGDGGRLAQVVANLLTNAAKYSDHGTTIRVDAERVEDRVQLRVRDHGIGITHDMLHRVFDLFFQQEQALDRASGGLGLGLAIVRTLVAMHGGSVVARSEGIGKGSEFVVTLPLLTALSDAAEGQLEDTAPPRRPKVVAGERRVLVVDDNGDAAEMLAEILVELGFTVEKAHDGPSALQVARHFRPDIALLDIGLPVMDGYELARLLRQEADARRMKLVAVTGYGQGGDRARARDAGFDDHLVKPVTVDVLVRTLAPDPV